MSNITFGYGMAGKGYNGVNPVWFGRCWGFWLPTIKWNHGLVWRKEVCDISIMWLCFHAGVILWP